MFYWKCSHCDYTLTVDDYRDWKREFKHTYSIMSSRCTQCSHLDEKIAYLAVLDSTTQREHMWMFMNPKKDALRRLVNMCCGLSIYIPL
jgi:phage terminase large subunit GpA-like protein